MYMLFGKFSVSSGPNANLLPCYYPKHLKKNRIVLWGIGKNNLGDSHHSWAPLLKTQSVVHCVSLSNTARGYWGRWGVSVGPWGTPLYNVRQSAKLMIVISHSDDERPQAMLRSLP